MTVKQQKNQCVYPFRERVGVNPRELLLKGLKPSGRDMTLKARHHLRI